MGYSGDQGKDDLDVMEVIFCGSARDRSVIKMARTAKHNSHFGENYFPLDNLSPEKGNKKTNKSITTSWTMRRGAWSIPRWRRGGEGVVRSSQPERRTGRAILQQKLFATGVLPFPY